MIQAICACIEIAGGRANAEAATPRFARDPAGAAQ